MPKRIGSRSGRPKNDPNDPQVPVNAARVKAALYFAGLSQRDAIAEIRRRKLPAPSVAGIHNLTSGKQRTSRRSQLQSVADVTGVALPYLSDPTEVDFLDAMAGGFAAANWDSVANAPDPVAGVRRVAADARPLLELENWRKRTQSDAPAPNQDQREEFARALTTVLRMAFGPGTRRHAKLRELREWLDQVGG